MKQNKAIEQYADEYAQKLLDGERYVTYHTLMPETIKHYLAGAAKQKELDDEREKLLMGVIDEMKDRIKKLEAQVEYELDILEKKYLLSFPDINSIRNDILKEK